MRIDINNQVFSNGKFKNVLSKSFDNQVLMENDWFFKNDYANGLVKDIRINGMCFLAYNLNSYKNNEMLVSNDTPLFKLHFELGADIKYICKESKDREFVSIKKDRFEFLYLPKENNKIESTQKTKNSVEIFIDESYLRGLFGKECNKLLAILKNKTKEKTPINYGVFITEEILNILETIKNCEFTGDKRNIFLELKIKELIIIALIVYEDNCHEGENLTCTKQSLQSIENYIKLNLKKPLNIPDLSVLSGMNTSKFKKCFKELYGTTVFKYITSLRIERAKVLIQQKSYTISQASYEVGYKNAQHFTVAFKKNMGYLPSELKSND